MILADEEKSTQHKEKCVAYSDFFGKRQTLKQKFSPLKFSGHLWLNQEGRINWFPVAEGFRSFRPNDNESSNTSLLTHHHLKQVIMTLSEPSKGGLLPGFLRNVRREYKVRREYSRIVHMSTNYGVDAEISSG